MTANGLARQARIGLVGVGRMGSGVLGRLSQSGAVAAFDSDHGRREAVSRAGGTWMDSVAAVAQVSEVFITVLPGSDEADAVMNEAFHALTSGALWLDLTSGDPVRVAELTAKAADRGIDAVAAPMGGGPADAAAGTLMFYVGGSSDPVARAEAILRQLSAEGGIRMCGPNPSDGHTVKLLANALWFANALAATEALLIGQAQGLAPQQLQALLADSAGSSTALSQHLPRLFEGDYLASFGIDRVVEELGTVAALARSSSTTSRLLDASAGVHREALARFGPVPGELLGARVIEELAGRYLR